MGKGTVVELPDDIEVMPPGPRLVDVVSSVDREQLAPDDLLRVAQARVRLIAQQEALLLADLHRVARTVPEQGALPRSVTRQQGKYPWAEVECAFALRWTHWRAAGELVLADELLDRLPQVWQALECGDVDRPKASLIADAVAGLDDESARAVADRVLPVAGGADYRAVAGAVAPVGDRRGSRSGDQAGGPGDHRSAGTGLRDRQRSGELGGV